MHRARRGTIAVLSALTLLAGTVVDAGAAGPSTKGRGGAGDPYFPYQGNGGYDVQHYRLSIVYNPKTHRLVGTAVIEARATQKLTRFDLDLRPNLKASSVTVGGHRAAHAQPAAKHQELVITPRSAIAEGHRFTTVVRYAGTATAITDPDGSPDGWIVTNDGAFVANEPQGAPSWFPVNDSPRDKATYTVSVSVPKGLVAVSNGKLLSHRTKAGRTVWSWKITQPISSYLVTATIGKFRLRNGTTGDGVPYTIAVDPTLEQQSAAVLAKLPAIVDYFSSRYGAYPFGQAGAIVDNAPDVGYALEVATRPIFDRAPDELTLAHELAHEWFGDTVTLKRWRDIWINEGFAEFSSWLWDQHRGGTTAHQHLEQLLALPAGNSIWNPPPGNPGGPGQMFAGSVYERGAGALEALREKLGNHTFFAIMKGWVAAHRYGNATTLDFTRYASAVAHKDLKHFFDVWLYRSGKP